MKGEKGKFGFHGKIVFPCILGSNERGGMDKEKFEKNIFKSIIPPFPNVKLGKRVLIKIESRPGWSNSIMMCSGLEFVGHTSTQESQTQPLYHKKPIMNLVISRQFFVIN